MSLYECACEGCGKVISLQGDASAAYESIGGIKVFFCSDDHRREFVGRQRNDPSAEAFAGYGPDVFVGGGVGM